jgi:hypothetical protein
MHLHHWIQKEYWAVLLLFITADQLTSNWKIKSIHWPCYCTVHVYVVIHFCDSMWSFWVEANLCRFFLLFAYITIAVGEIQLSRGEGCDPINRFYPARLLCLSMPVPGFPTSHFMVFICVWWVKVRVYCSFCWYWWNCWPSMLKLSFHNFIKILQHL